MAVEEIVILLLFFSIISFAIWAFYKKLSWDNIAWREAAERNKLQYKNMHYHAVLTASQSPLIDLRDLSQFLPVINDPSHVISTKHTISGSINGRSITLIDAEAGFNFAAGINLMPRQTAPFFFLGHISSPASSSILLIKTRKPLGEINLQPNSQLTPQYKTDSFTIFANSNNDKLLREMIAVKDRYNDQPPFDLAIVNDSIYIFSPFRPDPEKWIKLLTEVAEIK